jgi:hypothetical protein
MDGPALPGIAIRPIRMGPLETDESTELPWTEVMFDDEEEANFEHLNTTENL